MSIAFDGRGQQFDIWVPAGETRSAKFTTGADDLPTTVTVPITGSALSFAVTSDSTSFTITSPSALPQGSHAFAVVADGVQWLTGTVRVTPVGSPRQSPPVSTFTITAGPLAVAVTVTPGLAGPAGPGVPEGGTTGDVYVKQSLDAFDGNWEARPAGLAPREGGTFLPLRNVVVDAAPTYVPVWVQGDVIYGRGATGPATSTLFRSTNEGATWELVHVTGGGTIRVMRATGDGEVILSTGGALRKSAGWSANPLSATWSTVATPTTGASFLGWGLDTHANLVLVAEYALPRTNSRFLRLSTDNGDTFSNVLDLDALYPGQEEAAHWHACCIDGFKDGTPRLWASHGDGVKAIFYSDDLGDTWETLTTDYQPTVLASMPSGIVASTDEHPDGVWRVLRTDDPADMVYEEIHRVVLGNQDANLYGFAETYFYDAAAEVTYITFRSDVSGVDGFVFATDGYRAATVARHSPGATAGPIVVTPGGDVWWSHGGSGESYRGDRTLRGGPTEFDVNRGQLITNASALAKGALAIGHGSVAAFDATIVGQNSTGTGSRATVLGQGVSAGDGNNVTALGQGATAAGANHTVIGQGASALASSSTVIGRAASAAGANSVVIGDATTALAANAVSIGQAVSSGSAAGATSIGHGSSVTNGATALGTNSSATNANATALGRGSTASGNGSTALGHGATAGPNSFSLALGRLAAASHQSSIALGYQSTTTANDQVAIGARHIEVLEIAADPAAPAEGAARLYTKDNGAGKTQLCVRFATGAVQVLATEP